MKSPWNITQQIYQEKIFSSLEKQFSQYISPEDHIAVAVSGGPDSMFLSVALYNFFVQHTYNLNHLIFIHLNHNVRDESTQELKLIKQRFQGTELEVVTRPKTLKASENDLRKRRYQAFLDIMNKRWISKIFLGHHFDDRVETSLLNLVRWCGIDGFMAIKAMESHHLLQGKVVIRPLLSLRKQQILETCDKVWIPYVQDSTNRDSSVSQRNYLRNELLPDLFSQKWFEQLFQKRYKKYDSQSLENLLQPITISPHRKATSAYCLSKNKKEVTAQDLLRIFKQLHASSGITSKTLQEFLQFIHSGTTGRKYFQGVTIMIAHTKVYFFVAPLRFREKNLDNNKQITTLYYKGKTWNKYCIAQKIPIFRRNFIPVVIKGNKIVSRDKKQRKSTTIF